MPVSDRPQTLQDLARAVAAHGAVPAVAVVKGDATATWSYAELGDLAWRLAQGLVAAGLAKGEPVVAVGPNSAELVAIRLALAAAGALAVPLDDLGTAEEIRNLTRDSKAKRVFTTAAHLPAVQSAFEGATADIRLIDAEEPLPGWRSLLAAEGGASLPELSPDEPTVLVYTSGTTGNPKGFTLSHANILHNVEVLAAEDLVNARDRVLMALPLHHVYPFVMGMLMPLRAGAEILLPEAARGPEIIKALVLGRATGLIGVPGLYRALVQGIESRVAQRGLVARTLFRGLLGLSTWIRRATGRRIGRRLLASLHRQLAPELRVMSSGGAHLDEKVAWTLEGLGWACYSGYGLAETASVFTGNMPGRQKMDSDGQPLPGGQLRIANPNEAGVGEIQLKGPSVFAGYRNNDAANREAFTEDGWFRTGDLGRVDSAGYLYVTGRIKEMIVLEGGKNVFPDEIEGHLEKSPSLREVAILEYEGRLVALVLPDMQEISKSSTRRVEDTVRVALAELGRQLPSFQRPAGFAILREPLPRTRLGKVRRHLLPPLYEAARSGRAVTAKPAPSAEDTALLTQPLAGELWRWLQSRYPKRELSLDDNPDLDLGIDSLEWINLSLELQDRFAIRLSEAQIAGIGTLRDLLQEALKQKDTAQAAPAQPAGPSEEQLKYLHPASSLWQRIFRVLLYWLNRGLCRLLFRVEAVGLENLPERGPYILAPNHVSDLDPLVVAACQPLRRLKQTRWGAEVTRLFRGPLRSAMAHAVNIFPVDERAPQATLAMAVAVLERGESLVWFPESWRSPDGSVQRFLPGIGFILERMHVPVVPVRILGTFEAMPRTAGYPRPHKVRVVFGKPISAEELDARAQEGERHQALADVLHHAVAQLDA